MTYATKHAPGPWKVTKNSHGWFLKTKDGCIIGGVNRYPETALLASQCEPNARLIAAAPEILEALVAMVVYANKTAETDQDDFSPEGKAAFTKARGAIAKAGGSL